MLDRVLSTSVDVNGIISILSFLDSRQGRSYKSILVPKSLRGVIHKVRTLRFRNFRPLLPLYMYIPFQPTLPSRPNTSVRILFFKEDITYFVNQYHSKNHEKRCKIKKLLYRAIGKCRTKTSRRALGSRVCFLTVRGRWERIILAVRLAHFPYFIYSWTSPLPLIRASALLAGLILPLYKCTYFMDDPPSVRPYIYIQFLLESSSFVFFENYAQRQKFRNRKKDKWIFQKNFVCLKMGKKSPQWSFLEIS